MKEHLFNEGKPSDSMVSLLNNEFKIAGEVMVMSIIQGGPAPAFIAPSAYAFLTGQPLDVDSVADPERDLLRQVSHLWMSY